MEKNGIRSKGFVRVVTTVLLLTMMSWLLPVDFMTLEVEAATKLMDPVIVKDTSEEPLTESGQTVTWDCIYFGSYPQSEVVCETDTERINELKNDYYEDDYVTVDSATWDKITGAQYSESGDATIDGVKYKRLKKGDANFYKNADGYYNWGNWSNETVHYFMYEPIKWRVLKVDGNDAFLLADKGLDDQSYNISNIDITWETCTLRSWLNGYGESSNVSSMDYTGTGFIDTAFSSEESDIIKETDIATADNDFVGGQEGGNDTVDKIFLLAVDELEGSDNGVSYGFVEDEGRRCLGTTYAKAMGVLSDVKDSSCFGNCIWWSRSPGTKRSDGTNYYATNYAVIVRSNGYVFDYGEFVYSNDSVRKDPAVRPALHLDISKSDIWDFAGTVSSDGTETEENLEDLEWVNEVYKLYDVANSDVTVPDCTYDSTAREPEVTVMMGDSRLILDKDYTVSYQDNIDVGIGKVIVTGKGLYHGTIEAEFDINLAKISGATLSTTTYTYNGKVKKPSVTVKNGSKKVSSGNYTVTYASGRKNVGKYKVTVKGKGNFTGTKTLYFTINPKATSISKLTKGKKSFKVKWKKVSSQASGYQIQYATNSKFTKNKKTVTVKSYKTTSKTVTKLKAKKKYYVKIRTYKKVGSTTYYSGWSKYKTVKTR